MPREPRAFARTRSAANAAKTKARKTARPAATALRGRGRRPTRMSKEVENDRVSLFVESILEIKEKKRLDQIWLDLSEFKSAVYGGADGRITEGRAAILDNITYRKNLTYIWNRSGTQIGFIGYSETDEDIVNKVLDTFYLKAGRR
jgi:hypothetical protein